MMKKVLATLGVAALMVPATSALAQLDAEVVVDQATILAVSGASATDLDGLAVRGNDVYFFDSIGDCDCLMYWDGTTLTTYVTEAQFEAALGCSGMSLDDLTIDSSGVLYAKIRCAGDRIVRIPSAGVVESMVGTVEGTGSFGVTIDTVADPDRLLIGYSTAFSGTRNDLRAVPLTATNATPTVVSSDAQISAARPGSITPSYSDMTVLADGSIIWTNFNQGDVQLIDGATGAATLWASAADLLTAMGDDGSGTGLNNSNKYVHTLSNGNVVMYTTGGAAPGELFFIAEPDFSASKVLATEAEILAFPALGGTNDLDGTGAALTSDSADNIYWAQRPNFMSDTRIDGVLRLINVDPTGVAEWTAY